MAFEQMFFFILFRLSLFLFYLLIKTEKRPKSSFPFRSLSQKILLSAAADAISVCVFRAV
ncbi:hypothetical protein HMPREF1990_00981 [Porphyromonas gingivalis W4087]|uniref:Uncharacterized protein n=1 Tax=Porphyromonas gingivalis F0570 TaxID=1227271 RepID=A0A0E2LST1_PORGN|nr:hypothetical protein HMPREF1555_00585 [Porphyromonas gingivalis F0570]ERJ89285.1 hypothetical protein HMPREF1990_00981 [Porphyromonas gingivalis W4087]